MTFLLSYLPIVLSDKSLPRGHHGFHLSADGRPFALVFRGKRWSVTASHELMEMILDPSGTLTVSAPSLADECAANGVKPPGYTKQGMVEYLVEPCDPVEEVDPYTIDGVEVSDFVTPAYYDSFRASGVRYSFLGSVTQPLEVCDGGYLSWCTQDPPNSIWQAHAQAGSPLKVDRLKDDDAKRKNPAGTPPDDFLSRFSRDQVAVRTSKRGRQDPEAHSASQARQPERASWKKYGTRFKADVKTVIKYLDAPPPPTLRDVINALKEIRDNAAGKPTGPAFHQALKKYNIRASNALTLHGNKPANVKDIIKLLESRERISNILDSNAADPDAASWLCYLMP